MVLIELIKLLNDKNWKLSSASKNYQFFTPPEELGFDSSYSLPVPSKEDTINFNRAIKAASNVISDVYQKDFEQLVSDVENYLDVLKKDAVFFKLSSNEAMFGDTLEVNHIWKFLKNISTSYTNFLHIDFYNTFKEVYNSEKLKKIADPVLKYSRLRLVDLEYKSFSIGVSSDSMMGNTNLPFRDVIDWRKDKVLTYRKEVIDIDYGDKNEIDSLLEKYNDEERKGIFGPIIQSINSKEHKVFLTDPSFKPKKELRRLPPSTVDTIIPKQKDKSVEQDIEMVQLITAVDKSKKSITIKTEDLEGDLFSQKTTEFLWNEHNIVVDDNIIHFKNPITYKVTLDTEDGIFRASHEILPIDASSKDLKQMKSLILEQIIEFYKRHLQLKESTGPLGPEAKELVSFFMMISR
jgi:hypothetical protein